MEERNMKLIRKLALLLALVLTLGLSLAGCSSKENKNESKKNLEEVDIVLDWYPNAVHSYIYTAIEKGYFEEEGLKVNVRFPANPTDPIALPAAGKATLGIYYLQDIITARANEKVPVKSIGAVVQSPLSIVMSLKDKNITSAKDLQGKTVGYSGTPLSEAIVKTIVKENGGDVNSVKLVDVGFDLMASMTTGNVDATIGALINHEVPVMREQGFEVNYFSPTEYGVPNYYELVYVASDDTIKNKPETLKKFLRASKKGFDFMKKNPDEALNILLSHQNKDNFPLTESVEKQSMNTLLPVMESEKAPFLSQTKEVWEKNINWLFDKKLINEKPAVDEVFIDLK